MLKSVFDQPLGGVALPIVTPLARSGTTCSRPSCRGPTAHGKIAICFRTRLVVGIVVNVGNLKNFQLRNIVGWRHSDVSGQFFRVRKSNFPIVLRVVAARTILAQKFLAHLGWTYWCIPECIYSIKLKYLKVIFES